MQSHGMASLTAGSDLVSEVELKRANQTQTLGDRNDFSLRLLWSHSIQEEVDIRSWKSSAVKVFAEGPLGSLVGIGDREKAGQNGSASGDDVIPVEK